MRRNLGRNFYQLRSALLHQSYSDHRVSLSVLTFTSRLFWIFSLVFRWTHVLFFSVHCGEFFASFSVTALFRRPSRSANPVLSSNLHSIRSCNRNAVSWKMPRHESSFMPEFYFLYNRRWEIHPSINNRPALYVSLFRKPHQNSPLNSS